MHAWLQRLTPEFDQLIKDEDAKFDFYAPFKSALQVVSEDCAPYASNLLPEISVLTTLVNELNIFNTLNYLRKSYHYSNSLKPLLTRCFPDRHENMTIDHTFIEDEFRITNDDQDLFWQIIKYHLSSVIDNENRLSLPTGAASLKAELRKWSEKIDIRHHGFELIANSNKATTSPPSPQNITGWLNIARSVTTFSNAFYSCDQGSSTHRSAEGSSYHSDAISSQDSDYADYKSATNNDKNSKLDPGGSPRPVQQINDQTSEADSLPLGNDLQRTEQNVGQNIGQNTKPDSPQNYKDSDSNTPPAPPPFVREAAIFFDPRSNAQQRYLAQISALQAVLIHARNENDGLEDRINYLLWARDHKLFASKSSAFNCNIFSNSEAQKRIIAEIRYLRKQLLKQCEQQVKLQPTVDAQIQYLSIIRRHPTVTRHANTKFWHFPYGRTRTATVLDTMIKRIYNKRP